MLWFLKQKPDREGSTVGELKKKISAGINDKFKLERSTFIVVILNIYPNNEPEKQKVPLVGKQTKIVNFFNYPIHRFIFNAISHHLPNTTTIE